MGLLISKHVVILYDFSRKKVGMYMTREFAGTVAKKIVENSNTPHSIPVLAYGIEIIVNALIKFIGLTTIGLAFGLLKELYIMAFIFGAFRTITGGVHAQTFGRCFTISLGSFTILSLLIPYTLDWFMENAGSLFFISTLIGLTLIFTFVPGKWKGRTFSDHRIKASKWAASLFLFTILSLTWFAIHKPVPAWHSLSCAAFMGLYWQLFLVTPWGYKFIRFLETPLHQRRKD